MLLVACTCVVCFGGGRTGHARGNYNGDRPLPRGPEYRCPPNLIVLIKFKYCDEGSAQPIRSVQYSNQPGDVSGNRYLNHYISLGITRCPNISLIYAICRAYIHIYACVFGQKFLASHPSQYVRICRFKSPARSDE